MKVRKHIRAATAKPAANSAPSRARFFPGPSGASAVKLPAIIRYPRCAVRALSDRAMHAEARSEFTTKGTKRTKVSWAACGAHSLLRALCALRGESLLGRGLRGKHRDALRRARLHPCSLQRDGGPLLSLFRQRQRSAIEGSLSARRQRLFAPGLRFRRRPLLCFPRPPLGFPRILSPAGLSLERRRSLVRPSGSPGPLRYHAIRTAGAERRSCGASFACRSWLRGRCRPATGFPHLSVN